MGNSGSSDGGINSRRRHGNRRGHPPPPPPQLPQPDISSNRYVFAPATPYPPNPPQFYQNPGGYYPPTLAPAIPVPLPAPYDHRGGGGIVPTPGMDSEAAGMTAAYMNWGGGMYPCGPAMPSPIPYVEHQNTVTIMNNVDLKKETLRVEPDAENPGMYLVSFTFDATFAGRITIMFFAEEGDGCEYTPMKENVLQPLTIHFEQGLGQKFRQPSGTGIDFSMFEETELMKEGETGAFPLIVKLEATPVDQIGPDGNPIPGATNSQTTQAVFEKEKGEFQVRVVKQILWVNELRYELQDIYGAGNSVDGDSDDNDHGKECVICHSGPRDTIVLPCRHMCMCSDCAKVQRFQTNLCPICKQPVERLMEIKVGNGPDD